MTQSVTEFKSFLNESTSRQLPAMLQRKLNEHKNGKIFKKSFWMDTLPPQQFFKHLEQKLLQPDIEARGLGKLKIFEERCD